MLKGTQAYMQTTFSTVGQGEILVMLYDGAIKFLTLAKEKIREKDAGGKGILISKALDIINELDGSLSMEAGGALAKNLHQLYFVCSTRLLRANLRMDTGPIDSVLDILANLRDAYAQVLNTPEAKAASAQISAKLPAAPIKAPRSVPLPKQTAPTGVGHAHAQAAYAQGTAGGARPAPGMAGGSVAARGAGGLTEPAGVPAAPRAPVAPVAPVAPAMPTAAPAAAMEPPVQSAPVMPTAPVNMENRRSAAAARYGKIARTIQ